MPNEAGVNGSESLPEKNSQGQIPSGEGKSPSGQENGGMSKETYEQLLQKKDKALSELREKYESTLEDRHAELESKSRLSAAEKEEKASLEDQMAAIKTNPNATPWLKINEEQSAKIAESTFMKYDAGQAEDFVMEKAKAEGVEYEQFEKNIVRLMQLVDPLAEMYPSRRAKKAYDLFTKQQEAAKELEKMKENNKPFAERGGANQPKAQSKAEILESAIGSKRSEKAQVDLLKAIHMGQQEATSR